MICGCTHVAWLIDQGWPEYQITSRLGWRDGMLNTTYGLLFPNHDDDLVESLDAMFPAPNADQMRTARQSDTAS